jgi:hypothetical protein
VFESGDAVTAPAEVTAKANASVKTIADTAAVVLPNMKFLPVSRPERLWTRVRLRTTRRG